MGLNCSKIPSSSENQTARRITGTAADMSGGVGGGGNGGGNDSWNATSGHSSAFVHMADFEHSTGGTTTTTSTRDVPQQQQQPRLLNAAPPTQQQQQESHRMQQQQQPEDPNNNGPITRSKSKANNSGRRSIFRVGSLFLSNRSLKKAAENSQRSHGNNNNTNDDDHSLIDADSMDRSTGGGGRNGSDRDAALAATTKSDMFEFAPGSPRARADTYSHVHAAVMYNLSAAERSKHDQSVPMGVIGLRNLGNTCFLNSSLQCLSATIPLTDYFLGYDYRKEINKDNFLGTGGKLVVAYAELMKQMWLDTKPNKSVVEPTSFKKQLATFAPQFSGYHQQDAQELLALLLDGIHEDLNRVKTRPYIEDRDCDGNTDEEDAIEAWMNYLRRNKSLVVDLFQGQLKNTCTCLTCGHRNIRFEPFMYLSLPIPSSGSKGGGRLRSSSHSPSLKDCLDLYLEEEVLKGADQWYCEKCKTHVDATKKTDLWILPPILIVHLKRFKYNDYGKVGSKNDAAVQYPLTQWDLSNCVRSQGGITPMYDLYAVSNHMGGLGGGHYTALSMNRFDDVWYEFNDSRYRPVEPSIHKNHTKSAYLLFYNRSEGDLGKPLNERSPMIRRQSVSRPELWPHRQVENRETVRNYTRSSRRFGPNETLLSPSLMGLGETDPVRKASADSTTSATSSNQSSTKKRAKSSAKNESSSSSKPSPVSSTPSSSSTTKEKGTRTRARSGSRTRARSGSRDGPTTANQVKPSAGGSSTISSGLSKSWDASLPMPPSLEFDKLSQLRQTPAKATTETVSNSDGAVGPTSKRHASKDSSSSSPSTKQPRTVGHSTTTSSRHHGTTEVSATTATPSKQKSRATVLTKNSPSRRNAGHSAASTSNGSKTSSPRKTL